MLLMDPLADAARYAVPSRMAAVLCHDVAGSMQPVLMVLLVLDRRLQFTELDLAATAKNVKSFDALTKQAFANCKPLPIA